MPSYEENIEGFKRVADMTYFGRVAFETGTKLGMSAQQGEEKIKVPKWDELAPSTQDFWINLADSVVNAMAETWFKAREEAIFRGMTEKFNEEEN